MEPGVEELLEVCTVWMESTMAMTGASFSMAAMIFSTEVSV